MDELSFLSYSRNGSTYHGQLPESTSYTQEFMDDAPYMAQWQFSDVSGDDLEEFFSNRMMTQIRTHFGGLEVWRGFIGYMRLVIDGVAYIKDANKLVNRAMTSYSYENDEGLTESTYTEWFGNDESLSQFGPFEKVLSHPGKLEAILDSDGAPVRNDDGSVVTEQEDLAESEVARNAFPFVRGVAPSDEENNLKVTAYGAVYYANKILCGNIENLGTDETGVRTGGDETAIFGWETSVSAEIERIIDVVNYQSLRWSSSPLLHTIEIADNKLKTVVGPESPMGAWDRLKELTLLRDPNGIYYRLRVMIDGGILYEPWDYTPVYYLMPPPQGVQDAGGRSLSWDAVPNVILVAAQSKRLLQPSGWLEDGDIIIPSRVTMRDGTDFPTFGDQEYTESDFETMLKQNAKRVKEVEDKKDG